MTACEWEEAGSVFFKQCLFPEQPEAFIYRKLQSKKSLSFISIHIWGSYWAVLLYAVVSNQTPALA